MKLAALHLFIVWLCASGAALAEGNFKRFPLTISPDGRYVLAWGDSDGDELKTLTEIPADKDTFSVDGDEMVNYLVDTATGHPVAVIPEFHYFAGSEGRQNHRGLSSAWSADSKSGIAIYEGRYAYEAIVWMEPDARRFTPIGPLLEKALRRQIDKKHPKKIAELASSLSFTAPVIIGADTLVVSGWGTSAANKDEPLVDVGYRMQFKISRSKGKITATLEAAVDWDPDGDPRPENVADDQLEPELNKTYASLRSKLDEPAREALKKEQLQWLKNREGIAEEDMRKEFTRMKIHELKIRVGGK